MFATYVTLYFGLGTLCKLRASIGYHIDVIGTCNRMANNGGNNNGVLPEAPTLAQVISQMMSSGQQQAELLRELVQSLHHVPGTSRNNGADRQATYSDFVGTHPPTFTETTDPLAADN